LTLFTLVNASGERKKPQMRSHKWRRMFTEVRPNSHMLPSRTFGRTSASAELRPSLASTRAPTPGRSY